MVLINPEELKLKAHNQLYNNIIPFWMANTKDDLHGGFFGLITNDLKIKEQAPKSLILTTRILWTFSALYNMNPKAEYLEMAKHAYNFLSEFYFDLEYGGTYWVVDYKGKVKNDNKKIYGQAFSIYALSEYFRATDNKAILNEAINIFNLIEKHNFDENKMGYFETSNRNWTIAEEMRLSEVDMNEVKSMNTHLHLMEAYTSLYQASKSNKVKSKLNGLINNFLDFVIDPDSYHFKLFFNEDWKVRTNRVSFGHDIEGSWLLCKAVDVLGDDSLKSRILKTAIKMVDVTIEEGFSKDHRIYTEKYSDGTMLKHTHWWQQAEAVVGLVNAFQISKDEKYLSFANNAWDFIENYLVDKVHGEWFYEIMERGNPNSKLHKVSEWKGPYHNARACLELIKRL